MRHPATDPVRLSAPLRLSVVIVTLNEAAYIRGCLGSLLPQLGADDEVIVVDNGSEDGTLDVVAEVAPHAHVVRLTGNPGYMAACNTGADRAMGDLLVLLNPDTTVAPGFADAIRRPLDDGRGWAAWQALLTQQGGTEVNTSGGVTHFTGISWAGEVGRRVAELDPRPREVAFASSACLAVPRERWERVGGFPAEYFLYFDDVDISLRLRLLGGRVGIEPAARVEHHYDFARRSFKWRMLERNRWATIVRTYPGALLALLAPALVATEVALLGVALAGGWLGQKLAATADTLRELPRLLAERRRIQAERTVGAAAFAAHLTGDLSSPFLSPLARSPIVRWGVRAYWAATLALLGPVPAAAPVEDRAPQPAPPDPAPVR
jgi:GT2 family glycosyltransferase